MAGNIAKFFKKMSNVSLLGFFRYLKLKIVGKTILLSGHCNGCGVCCRKISLESDGGWVRSEKTFEKIVAKYPEYSRFEILGQDEQGFILFNCTWLTDEGICKDYENRLPLCKAFPEVSLLFSGGQLPVNCGYKFSEVVPFEKILKDEIEQK